MHIPSAHNLPDQDTLLQFINENALGLLITGVPSSIQDFLQCSHIPFVLDQPNADRPYGTLRGHVAKQNPQVASIKESVEVHSDEIYDVPSEVLVLFNGQHHHYVTPKFYTSTKPDTGKVVPTWNYSAVQAYGKLRLYYNSKSPTTEEFLDKQLHDLSHLCETSIMGYDGQQKQGPWKVTDAPEPYIRLKQRNIVGIEIEITKLQGKHKMSQESPLGDRVGVIEGFEKLKSETGTAMASLVKERSLLVEEAKSKKQVVSA